MRNRTLKDDLGSLLDTLCTEWGFCLPSADHARIAESQRLTADEFACQVLTAEGFVPEYEKKWRREVGQLFRERFGEVASADDYQPREGESRRR